MLHTFAWVSYVRGDRRTSAILIREARALRAEIAERDKTAHRNLTEYQNEMIQIFERLDKNLRSTLSGHQKSYIEQLKIQAFNSHLAVQDLKSFMSVERDQDG